MDTLKLKKDNCSIQTRKWSIDRKSLGNYGMLTEINIICTLKIIEKITHDTMFGERSRKQNYSYTYTD